MRYRHPYYLLPTEPRLPKRYTQTPSPELCNRRPDLDPSDTAGHSVRKPRLEDGVSFCEPIWPDWY